MTTRHEIFDRVLTLFIKHAATPVSGQPPEEQVKQEVNNCLEEDNSSSQELSLSERANLIDAENAAAEFLKCLKKLEQSVNSSRQNKRNSVTIPERQGLWEELQNIQGDLVSKYNKESNDTGAKQCLGSALESSEQNTSKDKDDTRQANLVENHATTSLDLSLDENKSVMETAASQEQVEVEQDEPKMKVTPVQQSDPLCSATISTAVTINTACDPEEHLEVGAVVKSNTESNDSQSGPMDTQGMWRTIDSDPNAPHHKEDEDHKCFELQGGMRLIAASVRGRSHAHTGLHRDDDFELHHPDKSGWSILAVADGAGSCEYSRRGSQIAVKTSVEKLRETLDGPAGQSLLENYPRNESDRTDEKLKALQNALHETLVTAAYSACESINKEALKSEKAVKLYSTTLLLAAHKHTTEGHFIISFWVGDGGIVIYHKDGDPELLGQPDGGEYAGQTRFLDDRIFKDPAVVRRARIRLVDDFTALILATDGITDPLFESDSQLSQKQPWDNLWSKLEPAVTVENGQIAEHQLMEWAGFFSPGNHDDRTIALLTHREAGSHD